MNTNDDLFFFDCNASYGAADIPPLKQSITPAELLDEMDFCGIDEALVTSNHQRGSPWDGNVLLVDQVKDFPRLHPVWVVLPHQTGEMPEPVRLIREMKSNYVKALWAFPGDHHYLEEQFKKCEKSSVI